MNITVRIKNLRARTIIGIHQWEKEHPQEVVINVVVEFSVDSAIASDSIDDTVNYQKIKKMILREVEGHSFELLEKLTAFILAKIMEDERILKASVEIDKPHALRFADSVSVECSAER